MARSGLNGTAFSCEAIEDGKDGTTGVLVPSPGNTGRGAAATVCVPGVNRPISVDDTKPSFGKTVCGNPNRIFSSLTDSVFGFSAVLTQADPSKGVELPGTYVQGVISTVLGVLLEMKLSPMVVDSLPIELIVVTSLN